MVRCSDYFGVQDAAWQKHFEGVLSVQFSNVTILCPQSFTVKPQPMDLEIGGERGAHGACGAHHKSFGNKAVALLLFVLVLTLSQRGVWQDDLTLIHFDTEVATEAYPSASDSSTISDRLALWQVVRELRRVLCAVEFALLWDAW